MTARRPCPPAPGPLEDYAQLFDPLFHSLAQRRSFRTYLAGLLAPRDRPKTLTALAGAEPLIQAQAAPVQQLQFFLSESSWDADAMTARTLQLLGEDTRRQAMPTAYSSSTTPATARMAVRPSMWHASTWARRARSITGSWR